MDEKLLLKQTLEQLDYNANKATGPSDCFLLMKQQCKVLHDYVKRHELALRHSGRWVRTLSADCDFPVDEVIEPYEAEIRDIMDGGTGYEDSE